MRVLNLAMKSRRNACVTAASSSGHMWTSVIDPFIAAAVDVMKSDLLSKVSPAICPFVCTDISADKYKRIVEFYLFDDSYMYCY